MKFSQSNNHVELLKEITGWLFSQQNNFNSSFCILEVLSPLLVFCLFHLFKRVSKSVSIYLLTHLFICDWHDLLVWKVISTHTKTEHLSMFPTCNSFAMLHYILKSQIHTAQGDLCHWKLCYPWLEVIRLPTAGALAEGLLTGEHVDMASVTLRLSSLASSVPAAGLLSLLPGPNS